MRYLQPVASTAAPAAEQGPGPQAVTWSAGPSELEGPVRVGVAFAPGAEATRRTGWSQASHDFGEPDKRRLLTRLCSNLEATPAVAAAVVVPTYHMQPAGGFDDLERLAELYDVDLIVLLSYEQLQAEDVNALSVTYWALLPAYFVRGNVNETRTIVDADVYEIDSRTHIFNASGSCKEEARCTALKSKRLLRTQSREGFKSAIAGLTEDLSRGIGGALGS